jgi:hypothetical protein
MKPIVLALVLAAAASPIAAQTTTTDAAATMPAAAAPALTTDMSIQALMADPRSKAVLDANVPGMADHPMYEQFKGMTLVQLQPMSQGKITETTLEKISAGLAAIK